MISNIEPFDDMLSAVTEETTLIVKFLLILLLLLIHDLQAVSYTHLTLPTTPYV